MWTRTYRRIWRLALVTIVISSGSAEAQNLLTNPDFDLDPTNPANGWIVNGTGLLSHSLGTGDPAPPSARVDTTGPQWLDLHQCVEVDPGAAYDFWARSYTHTSYGSSSNSVSVSFFSTADCSSGLILNVPTEHNLFPNWSLRWSHEVVAPPGASSARIELAADGADAEMDISWDDVMLRVSPPLFADGFESGSTNGWSASVPGSGDPTELQCIDSGDWTLVLVGEWSGQYFCRPAEGPCEQGFLQRTDTEGSCEAKQGCVFDPGFCYCPPDLVCFCGGGPPPQCVESP